MSQPPSPPLSQNSAARVFYFGCWSKERIGHFLYDPTGRTSERMLPDDFPIRFQTLDGGLLPPKQPETEGLASHFHINGWTIITFWDRSADGRGACNSSFIIDGHHSFGDCCLIAAEFFPSVWNRFKFKVVTAPGRTTDFQAAPSLNGEVK